MSFGRAVTVAALLAVAAVAWIAPTRIAATAHGGAFCSQLSTPIDAAFGWTTSGPGPHSESEWQDVAARPNHALGTITCRHDREDFAVAWPHPVRVGLVVALLGGAGILAWPRPRSRLEIPDRASGARDV
ncbi:hypothetical protein [Aeromicrobium sp. HA]|uniref:hypothetical protein n=1 Tax=Aeromicrobium sp. HA TaxID=3009077 RepID=UPI0022AF211E|nr:hypothetical protein [Aeromicrobium sp. HA]